MLPTVSLCVIAGILTFVPAIAWFGINAGSFTVTPNVFDHAAAPFWYIASIFMGTAIAAAIALAIRRRDGAALAALWAVVALAAAMNTAIAFGMAFRSSPGVYYEANPVQDLTRFTRIYYNVLGVNSLGHAQPAERKSWRFDEYGMRPTVDGSSPQPFYVMWEEYGLPFRCFISPLGMNFQHGADVIRRLRISPIAFLTNTLVLVIVMFGGWKAPRWVVARHRRQEGRCVACGYLLKGLPRCPECGSPVAVIPVKTA